ncbi:MAG: hypothetical protein GX081_00385 [Firmicutes bacterium]|nr:hypothetical protein [Bacillota bacterium]
MHNHQLNQTFQTIRTIIQNLKQAEQNNVNLARQLAAQEARNANLLNTGSNSQP